MKSINFSSKITKKNKSNTEEINHLEKGVTMALLEKYKPKVSYEIETFSEKKVRRRVA